MYNCYIHLKNQEKIKNNEKEKLLRAKQLKKDKIKRDKLSKNYENRLKNFINQLSDDDDLGGSINNKYPKLNDLINIEHDKKNYKNSDASKRFKFFKFETDRAKAEKYEKEKQTIKNIIKYNKSNKNEKNKKYISSSPNNKKKIYNLTENYYGLLLLNNNDINFDKKDKNKMDNNIKTMNQPRLRFKPRNDLERLFDEIKDLRLDQNKEYFKCLQKKLYNLQKKEYIKEKNNINEKKKNNNSFENEKYIDGYRNMDCLELICEKKLYTKNILDFKNYVKNLKNTRTKKLKNLKFLNKNSNSLIEDNNLKTKNFDIINSKIYLHKDYDFKTYFNGIKNYSLWKDTCFIKSNSKNNNINNQKNHNDFKNKSPLSLSSQNFYHFRKANNKRNVKVKRAFTPQNKIEKKIDIINKINSLKYILSNPVEIDYLKLKKYLDINNNKNCDNIDDDNNINENNVDKSIKLEEIKKIAFNENYISVPGKKGPRIFQRNKLGIQKELYQDIDNIANKRSSNDMSDICNSILEKYGQINKKYKEGYNN